MHIVMHGIKFTIYFGYSCMLLHVFSLIIIMGSHLSQKVSPQQAYPSCLYQVKHPLTVAVKGKILKHILIERQKLNFTCYE